MDESDKSRERPIILGRKPGEDDYYNPGLRKILSFNGTLLDSSSKLAKMHNQITASETGYRKKQRYLEIAGILSQWFDTSTLDQVSLILETSEDRRESALGEEIKKYLAFIDCFLRLEGNTIRWKTLLEISSYFDIEITRKSLFKYRVEAQMFFINKYGRQPVLEKLASSPALIMKRLVAEFITGDRDLTRTEKAIVRAGSLQIIDMFKVKQFIPRDYEIYAFAAYYLVRKELTADNGKYSFPVDNPSFRRSISNAIYNIKTKVVGSDPIKTVLSASNENDRRINCQLSANL